MQTLAFPADVDRVLEQKTVRDATSRALFLAAIRELGREGGQFTIERLEQFMRVEEHFQALLLYDQLDFLRQPASAMVNNHTFPSDSTTVPREPPAAFAAARVGNVDKCQKARAESSRPIGSVATMKQPSSRPARAATGTQLVPAPSVWPTANGGAISDRRAGPMIHGR